MTLASKWLVVMGVAACVAAGPAWGEKSTSKTTRVTTPAKAPPNPVPAAPAAKTNPLLPPQIAAEGFYIDLSLVQKAAATTPEGFSPLYTAEEWGAFRERFGMEADGLARQKLSGQLAFAEKLIGAATAPEMGSSGKITPGLQRLLLLRAAAIAYRTREGFPIADKAVTAYLGMMDKKASAQVGALWTIANQISRMAATPKPERIRYDAIAAKANMQLALLLLEADQVDAAQSITRQIAYHEGWLKSDPETRGKIAQVRAHVKATGAMMEYLATQYQPALRSEESALLVIYLYGRYVKAEPAIVADLPARVPGSRLAQLAAELDIAERGDMGQAFAAAEQLRAIAAGVPDTVIRQRTLYAALKLYDAFLASPQTERDRIHRTLALMAREGVVADGANKALAIDPFAEAAAPAAPAVRPAVPADQVEGIIQEH